MKWKIKNLKPEFRNIHSEGMLSQRGVSLLLVLAVLTVLAIIGSSFVYVMRTELAAATNFSDKYKADYFAEMGVKNATYSLVSTMTDNQGNLVPYSVETGKNVINQTFTNQTSGTAHVKVTMRDEESKLNLFVACDTEKYRAKGGLTLTQFLYTRFDHAGFTNANTMAKNVAAELYSAYTDGQLNSMDSVRTLVGDTIYSVIGDYLTIYSYTANIDKHKKSRVDVNHASAKQIFDKLQPTLGNEKAAQLAVNLVDFRDADSIPTFLTVAGTTYRGVEQNPYINEVMPYSSTPDENGNDGQYIELYNPYNETLLLDGWKIEGAFGSIDLYGQIPPQAYFIVTDEYTDDADYDGGTPDGYCFLKNYGSVPTSQLVVNENLQLSKLGDTLRLYDSSGNLIDEVIYQAAAKNVSWEKNDPRVNTLYTCNGGTPYQKNAAYSPPKGTADETAAMIITNQSFAGIGDLGYVCASLPSHPWTTISIGTDTTGIRFADIIDLLSVTTDDKIVGQININTAPADVLMALPGMTPALSEEIVNYRTVHGKFNQITDLVNISGFLGTEKVDDNGDGSVDEENEQQSLFRQMADWITTRSNVFKIRSIGTTNKNGIPITTSSIEVVIDRSKEPVKTLFRKRNNP